MVACCADSNRARSGWSILAGVGLAFGFTLWCAWFSQADSGSEKPSGPGMTMVAKAFVQSLDESQRATALMAFDSPERTRWHFVPLQDKDRNPTRKGLRLEKMNDAQREMALALLKSGTSERGYDEARQIMSLETVLDDLEKTKANVRNPLWYFVSIFGEPGDEKGWGWRFEGHHLTLNVTLKGNQVVSATPSVFCSNPAVIKSGKKVGLATLPGTLSKAEALVESLSENQKGEARVKTLMAEVDQANAKAPAQPDEGIRWTALDDTQKKTAPSGVARIHRPPARRCRGCDLEACHRQSGRFPALRLRPGRPEARQACHLSGQWQGLPGAVPQCPKRCRRHPSQPFPHSPASSFG